MKATKNTFFLCLFLLGSLQALLAQKPSGDYLAWSATRRLAVDDFAIKTGRQETTPCFAQFTITFEQAPFGFFTKNFNKKVHNYFLPAASWMDTTANMAQCLRYQQTLFDLSEIYTRQLRKALRENRKQFLKNTNLTNDLNKQYMAAFAKRRIAYDEQTKFGTDEILQQVWESQIRNELAELHDYAFDE